MPDNPNSQEIPAIETVSLSSPLPADTAAPAIVPLAFKQWLFRAAIGYVGLVLAFLLAQRLNVAWLFMGVILLGAWGIVSIYMLDRGFSKTLAIGSGFILALLVSMLVEGVLLAPFVVSASLQGEAEIGTGITYNQITGNGLGGYFNMKPSSDVDGRTRYVGETNPSAAILEVIGDKLDIHEATIVLGMTTDSKSTNLRNTLLAMRFLGNADSSWADENRNNWLRNAIERIADGGEKSVSTVRGNLRFIVANAAPFGFSVTVKHRSSE